MPTPLADARSLLFVPGNRPERFEKAARSGADAVVLDLEDAVPPQEKAAARAAIRDRWAGVLAMGVPLVVRINAPDTPAWADDLLALGELEGLAGVMVPKAAAVDPLRHVHDALPQAAILPIIESAAGVDGLRALAGSPGVLRLAFGHIDFMADLGMSCDEQQSELAPLRFAMAVATRMAALAPAIDGVTVETGDEQRLRQDVLRAVRFGFGGKLCIHPLQVAAVHAAFTPTPQEAEWARRVIAADAAAQGAAVQLDGRMVDAPVVLQARRTLARARAGQPSPKGEAAPAR